MSQNGDKRRNFRQVSLTSYFSRAHSDGVDAAAVAQPAPKRSTVHVTRTSRATDAWDKLDNAFNISLQADLIVSGGDGSQSFEEPGASMDLDTSVSGNRLSPGRAGVPHQGENVGEMEMTTGRSSAVDVSDMDFDESEDYIELPNDTEQHAPPWSGIPLDQVIRNGSVSSQTLRPLQQTPNHTVLVGLPLIHDSTPVPTPGAFVDVWDDTHVRMPCSSRLRRPKSALYPQQGFITRWEIIRNAVIRSFDSAKDFATAVGEYHPRGFGLSKIDGLAHLMEKDVTPQEAEFFLKVLLPFAANLVIELPFACPQPIPLLKSGQNHTLTLSQHQIAHLLASMFFCTFHMESADTDADRRANYPGGCFEGLFALPAPSMAKRAQTLREKLKCLLTYFHKTKQERPNGLVSFTRRCLNTFPKWEESPHFLGRLHISHKGKIEDEGAGCLQVDFANKLVGGGVLHRGCVQEEIQFVIYPELIVSRLFTECLKPEECLIITGVERFSSYTGYADTFKWSGPHTDTMSRDEWRRRRTQIVAIDAMRFGKYEEQFKQALIRRELNKAYVGFARNLSDEDVLGPLTAVATGNWGCGVFGGDKRLKFIIQLLACAQAGRDMLYFTFGDAALQEELFAMYNHLIGLNVTVGDVFQIICMYHEDVVKTQNTKGQRRLDPISLFTYMYNCLGGP